MHPRPRRSLLTALAVGGLLVAIFAGMVVHFRAELRAEIHRTIIERNAAILGPVAQRQLTEREAASAGRPTPIADLLAAVLASARQTDMLGMVVYDARGRVLQAVPDSLLFADLSIDDYLRLLQSEPISRYDPEFPLGRYFAGMGGSASPASPVLEVLLPLHGRDGALLGFAQYYIDGRRLARELAAIDRRINRQTAATLGIGAALMALVVDAAYLGLRRAQRAVAERNERLMRANFELTLAAKASALGQITSHLIHGLQGPVAGLREVVSSRNAAGASEPGWEAAADYTDRLQNMIQEAVALLGDTATQTIYELTGDELAEIIRRRNHAAAEKKGVLFSVTGGFRSSLDSHHGSLLCLITSNLVQNAIEATDAGRRVEVVFSHNGRHAQVTVQDQGHGIPEDVRTHLFEPGRSGRHGGSGLGLAISHLLARQIGATLALEATGREGTTFTLTVPVHG